MCGGREEGKTKNLIIFSEMAATAYLGVMEGGRTVELRVSEEGGQDAEERCGDGTLGLGACGVQGSFRVLQSSPCEGPASCSGSNRDNVPSTSGCWRDAQA